MSQAITTPTEDDLEGLDDLAENRNLVTMSNPLTRAGHGLTLAEKRIVMIAASKINSLKVAPRGTLLVTKISAREYADFADCSMDAAYKALRDAGENLYNRTVSVFPAKHRRGEKTLSDKGVVKHMRWVGSATYHDGEGWIELAWWHEVVPHLVGLKRHFTSIKLQRASALRSIYSWKLLELLSRFERTGWAEYDAEDFAAAMDATPKQRQNFAAIRRAIIEPAVKELTEKDGWVIDWTPIKAGRKVAKIRFDFKRDPQGRLL